jgi:alkaline phosphatase
MEYGALEYYECIANDVNVKWELPFPKLCKLKKDETVVFSFIVYKSKTDRNRINKKVMSDPRMDKMHDMEMPFDMKRFSMGGFKSLITTKGK